MQNQSLLGSEHLHVLIDMYIYDWKLPRFKRPDVTL